MEETLIRFLGKQNYLIKLNKHQHMIPAYSAYLNYQFLAPPDLMAMPTYQTLSRSQKRSSKMSSRKGSTDIDSKTKFKTEVCKYWKNNMQCPFGDNCNFAHGDQEKRSRESLPSKYKTRCCHKFNEEGYCPYGARCQFIHCVNKVPRVQHAEILHCLSEETGMFFSFLEEQQRNNGKQPERQKRGQLLQDGRDNRRIIRKLKLCGCQIKAQLY